MGLIHATSLERWEEWERTRHRGRLVKRTMTNALRRSSGGEDPGEPRFVLRSRGGAGPCLLLAVDSASPTTRISLLTALPYLRGAVDVLAPVGVDLPELAGPEWTGSDSSGMDAAQAARALPERGITAVVTLGQHLAAGRIAHEFALRARAKSYVLQHGALTPFAPPLPPETTLLAWSEADGEFWRSGREDVTVRPIGSQLLWQARHEAGLAVADVPATHDPAPAADSEDRPIFLGQLHGAELPRRITGGAAYTFCRLHDGLYRPHPSEVDKFSRATHELWRRRGIEFAPSDVPLREVTSPVVAVFSTGVLEAAARGVPAYVFAPKAPDWVAELWDRYGMRRFGAPTPTPSPRLPSAEPAAALAEILDGTG